MTDTNVVDGKAVGAGLGGTPMTRSVLGAATVLAAVGFFLLTRAIPSDWSLDLGMGETVPGSTFKGVFFACGGLMAIAALCVLVPFISPGIRKIGAWIGFVGWTVLACAGILGVVPALGYIIAGVPGWKAAGWAAGTVAIVIASCAACMISANILEARLPSATIARRELLAYFLSPLGYVFMALVLGLVGVVFAMVMTDPSAEANRAFGSCLGFFNTIVLFAAPMITMRLISEESRSGTLETLMTTPVTDVDVVLGKFAGAMMFFLIVVAGLLLHLLALRGVGKPEVGPVLSGLVGVILMGAAVLSLGLFTSTLSPNQIVAAVLAFCLTILLWFIGWRAETETAFNKARSYICLWNHNESFFKGVIESRDVVYFVTFTALFLFFSVRVLEIRKGR
ncbi:MAG TPA: ABC transporter permease [Candidatus Brocadiia bacterium]|nr:ABC transporter permease [Candidatus Brocadiia bacterium]